MGIARQNCSIALGAAQYPRELVTGDPSTDIEEIPVKEYEIRVLEDLL